MTFSRQTWTIACWALLALLAVVAVVLRDPSIAIGVGVAAVWGLTTGFSGPARSAR